MKYFKMPFLCLFLTIFIIFCFPININAISDCNFVIGSADTRVINGQEVRNLKFFKDNAIVAERVFKNNQLIESKGKIPDGVVLELFDSGELRGLSFYKDGERNGKMFLFYKSGTLEGEAFFKNGKIDGLVTMYYENGNKMSEQVFTDGAEQYTLMYDEYGKLDRKLKNGVVLEEY